MEQVQLTSYFRTTRGKCPARQLRRQGLLPGVLYGGPSGNITISINAHNFYKLLAKGVKESTLINLTIEQEGAVAQQASVVLKNMQVDPVKRVPVHVDFYEVTMGRMIEINVSLALIGDSPGVKLGGILAFSTREITIECLPTNMVDHIDIDISTLQIGDSLTVADLSIGEGRKVLTDPHVMIVSVTPPMGEEIVAAAPEAPVEPEVIQKGKKLEEEA